ncbi:unnamed protein product [Mytilus edulis]|uniref:SCP domain-containing protein n=2 Tax=Mytilus TaxID=6548 RepID=A0A8B6E9T4_MYTGA|nr:unnamed protein product [Mytilus edulis]VDI30976.1 Hypothetical predicted protein [Mytilus galloprovincialis]
MDEKVCAEFRDEMVKSHNTLRNHHGSKQLRISEDLNRDTQMWANIIADKGYVQFSEFPGRGENVIFVETNGQRPSGDTVTELWYKEIENYDHLHPKWNKDSMNFTQMIWKSSNEMGIGISKVKGQNKYVIVAHYKPSGNINTPGEFRKNVLPPNS